MPKIPGFIGGSYPSLSPTADCQRTINFYPEIIESQTGRNYAALYPTPGLLLTYSLDLGNIRGEWAADGRCFAVAGQGLYELFTDGTSTLRGVVLDDSNPATISANGDAGGQLLICAGSKGYCYDLVTNTLSDALDTAHFGGYLDSCFVALDAGSSTLQISAVNDGTTWDAGLNERRGKGPDRWLSLVVNFDEIWLFGSQTSEVWRGTANAQTPYAPIGGALIQQGIAAPYSAKVMNNTVVWLGASTSGAGVVWRGQGYQPVRISTHAVEHAIQGYSTITDAVAFTYAQDGHSFYVLVFPTAGATWVYDDATGQWHERLRWDPATSTWGAYRPACHCVAFGKHLVGDRANGYIYEFRDDCSISADGATIRRVRRGPHIAADGRRVAHDRFELMLETGIGWANTGTNTPPQIMLRWSDDGGHTWRGDRLLSAGFLGQYQVRAYANRLGSSYDRIYEIDMADSAPWRIVDATVEIH